MAYENIQIDDGNFCMGMKAGTFATIDISAQSLKTMNETGTQQSLYTLSPSITNTFLSLAYTGPIDQLADVDGATFFTLEKVSSTQCQIKRWELDTVGVTLDLKNTITKTTAATEYYDALGMGVEYYRRTFDDHAPEGAAYIDINSASRISNGDRLFLGPSSDPDNENATEYVTVSSVSGTIVTLASGIVNQYVDGDDISFYKNIYLLSSLGYAGDISRGTMFKIDPDTGSVIETDNKGLYQGVTACKWCPYVQAVACVSSTNMVFVRPYDWYQNWKSMFMNNVQADEATVFDVYDVEFDDDEIYKLMRKVTLRDDDGTKTTTSWGTYNYRQDTLLPYTNSIDLYTNKAMMIGGADTTTLEIQVRDQFGVGLLNVDVTAARVSGDTGITLNPVDGKVTTDSNGYTSVGYTSGNIYEGMTQMSVVDLTGGFGGHFVDGADLDVLSFVNIRSEQDIDIDTKMFQKGDVTSEAYLISQIPQYMNQIRSIFCKTFFTTPGGDWTNPSTYAGEVSTYLPTMHVGSGDGPQMSFERGWEPGEEDPGSFENRISQWLDFESYNRFRQIDHEFDGFLQWIKQVGEQNPTTSGVLMAESDLQLDQMNLSWHGVKVGDTWYDYLWTQVSLNQFIFVEDAIPIFWSEKNPIDTDIWIRLRPFAYDLDSSTFKFMVKEVSYAGNTGYRDWTSYCTITAFDAGAGIYGLDVLCEPPADFHHNATVYIHIEVYDEAPAPNYIYIDYWFTIIPDYRFPYLDNLNPSREQSEVVADTNIFFEVKDMGTGVDIDSFELFINSRKVTPSIRKISDQHYNVLYEPTSDFYYNKDVTVSVKVSDSSENVNTLVDSYRFSIVESSDVSFVPLEPKVCKRGFPRFQDVSLLVLGEGSGVDLSTLRVQIHQYDVRDKIKILPVIYRTS